MSKVEKRFSVEEANALLPWLRAQLEQLQRLKGEYENKWMQLQRLRRAVAQYGTRETDPFFQQEAELDFLSIQARAILERIHQTGVLVKDIDWGGGGFPGDGKRKAGVSVLAVGGRSRPLLPRPLRRLYGEQATRVGG
ncbi:hypothetical protein JCM14720_21280 [Calditerricola yamamurae]